MGALGRRQREKVVFMGRFSLGVDVTVLKGAAGLLGGKEEMGLQEGDVLRGRKMDGRLAM